MSAVKISDNTHWIGVKDPELPIFDIVMETKSGTTYNAYVVKGEKEIALIDTVKSGFIEEYLDNIREVTPIENVDYIVVNHTEPDHSGAITELLKIKPSIKLICAAACVPFLTNTINVDAEITGVKDNHEIDLGGCKLTFKTTPYMHWPDTMMEYLDSDKVLFSCDGFAAHISSDSIFADEVDQETLQYETLYYFDSIMRPFSSFIGRNLKKLHDFEIRTIAPSHGPIIRENAAKVINQYGAWSVDKAEGLNQITIFYASAYGNTLKIAEAIADAMAEHDFTSTIIDASDMDESFARDEMEKGKAILFGTPTFNGDAVRPIWDAVNLISTVHTFGKKAAVFGSYGWSGEGAKLVGERLTGLRLKVFPEQYRARLVPSGEDMAEVKRFSSKLADFINGAG